MNVLALLFLLAQVATSSGKLIVLRRKDYTGRNNIRTRKLTCISDDDGSGLIWNRNLNWAHSSDEQARFACLNSRRPENSCAPWNLFCPTSTINRGWEPIKLKMLTGTTWNRKWEGLIKANLSTEWRTFVVKWDKGYENIRVYDTEKLLARGKVVVNGPRQRDDTYSLYIASSKRMLVKSPDGTVCGSTNTSSSITFPFYENATNICIEIGISMCAECRLRVRLYDRFYDKTEDLAVIEGSTMIAEHGLLDWKIVRIDKEIPMKTTKETQIILLPELEQKSLNPWWYMLYLEKCQPIGTLRYATIEVAQDYADGKYFWPNVTCQRLYNDESTVVNNTRCPRGTIGPYCSINCAEDLESDVNCRGIAICDERGCTCPPGFLGADCDTNCQIGQYGYGCNETCGLCKNKDCNFVTGHCYFICDNSEGYYIPPFCKKAINLPLPEIDFINETAVRVFVPVREEYKLILSSYKFFILVIGIYLIGNANILDDTTTMIGYTDELKPNSSYQIRCVFGVIDSFLPIYGKWKNFTNGCTANINFKVEIRNTSLTLKTGEQVNMYICPSNFLLENHETGEQISKGNLTKLPLELTNLTPYTLYKLTVSNGAEVLFSQKIQTLDGVPSNVRNVRMIIRSYNEVTLKWDPPLYPNGIVQKYETVVIFVKVQRYLGCDNSTAPPPIIETISNTPNFTTATYSKLKPYARYVVKIAAHTSNRGPQEIIEFNTNQNETVTEEYSNLRFQDNTLTWDAPEDCTTISGRIVAKIIVMGLGEAVENFSIVRLTEEYSLNVSELLYGAETYEARVYAVRSYDKQQNELVFKKLVFTTPPKAPPPVRNLEIYELDSETTSVYLRWLKPEPPINGEIEYYLVTNRYRNCEITSKIQPTEYCKLWNKYICATVKSADERTELITVAAVNVNVSTPGTLSSVSIISEKLKLDAPEMFAAEARDKGLVNLSWSHPWKTGGHLDKFVISAEMISSRLKMEIPRSRRGTIYVYHVKEYRSEYNETLHLLSSSTYKISIRGMTNTETYGERKIVEVKTPPAIGFEKELIAEVQREDSTILLHVPAVLNDTKDSLMNVVVKGPQVCTNREKLIPYLLEKAGIEDHEIAWKVATFPTDEYAGKTITIGDNRVRGYATNCPLRPAESYAIVVIVQTEKRSIDGRVIVAKTASIRVDEPPKRHHEAWLTLPTIFAIVGAGTFYFYRRSKQAISQQEVVVTYTNENPEVESIGFSTKYVCSTTPTSSDKEFLSRASTPYENGTVYVNDISQRGERMSPVKVKDFEDYVKQAIDTGMLHKQYSTLPRGQTKPWDYGKLPQNKPKNRYANLIAYDENRVTLEKLPDDPYSDYINANYIKGYKKEDCYIATQGPKANTVIDFWRMVWQEECYIICMLANLVEGGKVKCEQYWPDIGKKKKYGDIIVFNAKHTVFADFTFRTLHVTYEDEARKIEHLHYTAWPDHGVPMSTHSVVTYLKKLLATSPGNGPVVVHCSAGVGRTGTIILCDICLRRATAEGVVDVFAETEAIRSQRANMVDNNQQYLLAHLTLVECLLAFPTTLVCNEVLPSRIKELKTQLTIQRDSLEKMTWQDEALRPPASQAALSERNLAKNRFPELVSAKVSRVYLKRYPSTDEDSDYISAVYVDGVRLQNQYLAAQLPLPGTFTDFWRMVAEYKIELIIMLQPPDPKDATCCPIVPSEEFKPVPYINVRSKEFAEFAHYSSQRLILVDKLEKPVTEQQVTILCSTEWKAGRNEEPPETMSLVTLWQAAERISRGDGPTVVLCHDGVTGCGLYLALSFLLERISVEKECDVCLAIRAIRRSRPDFVSSLEHIEYLYEAAITYLKYFETYANFT
ncbi:Receptor-type tyrosine-protein phosphatase kappa [Habropoda laboriosa]|uniref:protein-tyrosine-phosphatase n=1 Tax=Habropoda laboriosa TaxID=597456 RepID=A0A0L7R6L6_9HYME|nr:Receptor-type tyrosine-protein phosphatase kappa [Habropoda laboriosa]